MNPQDWDKITKPIIVSNKGAGLLSLYGGSVRKMLSSILGDSEFQRKERKTSLKVEQGHWQEPSNQRALLESVAKALSFKSMDDWYTVSKRDIVKHGGVGMLYIDLTKA